MTRTNVYIPVKCECGWIGKVPYKGNSEYHELCKLIYEEMDFSNRKIKLGERQSSMADIKK